MRIRPIEPADVEAVVEFSLRAWAPVFVSIEGSMNPAVYRAFFPDWREHQRQAVAAACEELKAHTWVAEDGGRPIGFVAAKIHDATLGEIYMVAVDPAVQQRGIGRALTEFALQAMTEAGLSVAMVETGADPGHGPARQTYERCGFELWPVARYFKQLG